MCLDCSSSCTKRSSPALRKSSSRSISENRRRRCSFRQWIIRLVPPDFQLIWNTNTQFLRFILWRVSESRIQNTWCREKKVLSMTQLKEQSSAASNKLRIEWRSLLMEDLVRLLISPNSILNGMRRRKRSRMRRRRRCSKPFIRKLRSKQKRLLLTRLISEVRTSVEVMTRLEVGTTLGPRTAMSLRLGVLRWARRNSHE